jgi:hypothetical protein
MAACLEQLGKHDGYILVEIERGHYRVVAAMRASIASRWR